MCVCVIRREGGGGRKKARERGREREGDHCAAVSNLGRGIALFSIEGTLLCSCRR